MFSSFIVGLVMFYPCFLVWYKSFLYDDTFKKPKYSFNFLLLWSIICLAMTVFAIIGGTAKRIAETDAGFIALGELIGVLIGLYFIPLVLTYIIMFLSKIIKSGAKKIHDIANED